jgi:excinuclease ABC subunit C
MALQNAERSLKDTLEAEDRQLELLGRLQKRLHMPILPKHIECYDNSNISGSDPVASLVVFKDGRADTSAYRHFRIRGIHKPDDYAYMHQVLSRRFAPKHADAPIPDLIMVDGGRGQLNIACSVVADLLGDKGPQIIGIAKKDEHRGETRDKIYLPGRSNPVAFGRDADLLLFLQRIRDEAHRFAITFHRKRRGKRTLHSKLDGIPGIGKKRKENLIRHFGSVSHIRAATAEEISAVPGMNRRLARLLMETLKKMATERHSQTQTD